MCLIDERLLSGTFIIGDWPLTRVLLKNNAHFPWFILVPRIANVQEIEQLSQSSRYQLMDEISALSSIIQTYFEPTKLNVGALGNIVSQLHVHVVARFANDLLWPHGLWQASQPAKEYELKVASPIIEYFQDQLKQAFTVS